MIIGEEVKTAEGEIIGLFLKELVPRDMSPEDTIQAIHEQGGLAVIPHPYDIFRRSVLKDEAIERVKTTVDAIEGFNCRNILAKHDKKARDAARRASTSRSRWARTRTRPWSWAAPAGDGRLRDAAGVAAGRCAAVTSLGHRSLPMVHWISTYAKIRWRLGLKPTYSRAPPVRAVGHRAVRHSGNRAKSNST